MSKDSEMTRTFLPFFCVRPGESFVITELDGPLVPGMSLVKGTLDKSVALLTCRTGTIQYSVSDTTICVVRRDSKAEALAAAIGALNTL